MRFNSALPLSIIISNASIAASTNTVQFQGEVTTQTCSVNVNGSESNPVVLLPTVAESKLATKGSTTGDTTFTVNVTGCNFSSSDTTIKTVLTANNPTENGNLGNAGDATKVSIQLLDSDATTPLSFANGSSVTTSDMKLVAGASSTSQNLIARYYAEDNNVTAGAVIATAQYAITYK
ncbi:type 1 fimbrial protein (plasmid) [Serratia sp. JSRIV002]|uniref:fimbrial protein n=1 Tax=Serratia sp. JSRIV002 TaxID=2831894 RepID=UPI001CBB07FB|nr:fimbrial protein [Serratia sp. JSRIV002]UAN54653.1 type 1 fimbrial protein [Serratia sp. JSRIV002]